MQNRRDFLKMSAALAASPLAAVSQTSVASALQAEASEPGIGKLPTAPRQLFLDPAFLQQVERASLHINPPIQRELVIQPDQPWEDLMISFYLTVLEDNGKLRLWYICRDRANHPNVAYAESTDGVHWEKPDLGIVSYQGSTRNNMVGLTSLDGAVYKDPHAIPQERYLYVASDKTKGVVRFTSPDGLHWKADPKPLLPFRADSQNITLWDEQHREYVLYLRGWDVGTPWTKRLRKIVRLTAPSLSSPLPIKPSGLDFDPAHPNALQRITNELPTVLAADCHDSPNTDVYTIGAVRYPLDPRWYLGFPSFFHRDNNISDGRLEVQFAGSTDGIHWHRYDRAPYVAPGLTGSDSANMIFLGSGLVVRGDELWQYGTGFRSRHGEAGARRKRTDGVIFRYVQRVDGFVSLNFEAEVGHCITAPVKVDAPRLLVNVDTGALGSLSVGLQDSAGHALPGFDLVSADPVRTNATGVALTWRGRADLSALKGRNVRLQIQGSRVRLFGFRFQGFA